MLFLIIPVAGIFSWILFASEYKKAKIGLEATIAWVSCNTEEDYDSKELEAWLFFLETHPYCISGAKARLINILEDTERRDVSQRILRLIFR